MVRAVVRGARQLELVPGRPRLLEVKVLTAAVLSRPHALSLSGARTLSGGIQIGWPGRRPLCRRHPTTLCQGWANPGSGQSCWAQGWAGGSSLPALLSSRGLLGHPERETPGLHCSLRLTSFPHLKWAPWTQQWPECPQASATLRALVSPCASRFPTPAGPESLRVGVAVCLLPRAADSPERRSHRLGNLLSSPGPSLSSRAWSFVSTRGQDFRPHGWS